MDDLMSLDLRAPGDVARGIAFVHDDLDDVARLQLFEAELGLNPVQGTGCPPQVEAAVGNLLGHQLLPYPDRTVGGDGPETVDDLRENLQQSVHFVVGVTAPNRNPKGAAGDIRG